MQKRKISNYKKRNTSLALGEDELVAVAVQKCPCLYDKSHGSHEELKMLRRLLLMSQTSLKHGWLKMATTSSAIFHAFIDSLAWNSKVESLFLTLLTFAIAR